jgi:thymidylate kinase
MFTVAITGPDGAGKTTVINRVSKVQELPVKHIYMGIMLESGNIVLPTTRLILKMRLAQARKQKQFMEEGTGGEAAVPIASKRRGAIHRLAGRVSALFLFANLVAEEWYRQAVSWSYMRRGNVVLYDRHFTLEMLAYQAVLAEPKQDLLTRFHSRLLKRFYPLPDLVIYLDAPAEVLFERKGERTLAQLESWRQGYLGLKHKVANFVVVNANRPVDEVSKEVIEIIWKFHLKRSSRLPQEPASAVSASEPRLHQEDGEQ